MLEGEQDEAGPRWHGPLSAVQEADQEGDLLPLLWREMTTYRKTLEGKAHWLPYQAEWSTWRRREAGVYTACGLKMESDRYAIDPELVPNDQRCKGGGCYRFWRSWEWQRERDLRDVEAAQRRRLEEHQNGQPGGAATGRQEGGGGYARVGDGVGLVHREGGGLPGPQDAGNGTSVPVPTTWVTMTNGSTITFAPMTITYGDRYVTVDSPPRRPGCCCGDSLNGLWDHGADECTWKEGVHA